MRVRVLANRTIPSGPPIILPRPKSAHASTTRAEQESRPHRYTCGMQAKARPARFFPALVLAGARLAGAKPRPGLPRLPHRPHADDAEGEGARCPCSRTRPSSPSRSTGRSSASTATRASTRPPFRTRRASARSTAPPATRTAGRSTPSTAGSAVRRFRRGRTPPAPTATAPTASRRRARPIPPSRAARQAESCGRCHQAARAQFLGLGPRQGHGRRAGRAELPHLPPPRGRRAVGRPDHGRTQAGPGRAVRVLPRQQGRRSPTRRCAAAASCGSFDQSVHGAALKRGKAEAANCVDCHGAHEMNRGLAAGGRMNKIHAAETCAKCHGKIAAEFGSSVHAAALRKGSPDAPTCTDCHGEHDIRAHTDPHFARLRGQRGPGGLRHLPRLAAPHAEVRTVRQHVPDLHRQLPRPRRARRDRSRSPTARAATARTPSSPTSIPPPRSTRATSSGPAASAIPGPTPASPWARCT